jgi:hypothetical protein
MKMPSVNLYGGTVHFALAVSAEFGLEHLLFSNNAFDGPTFCSIFDHVLIKDWRVLCVMDNAGYHKGIYAKSYCTNRNLKTAYSVPLEPNLNGPAENAINVLKAEYNKLRLKSLIHNENKTVLELVVEASKAITKEKVANSVKHCLRLWN